MTANRIIAHVFLQPSLHQVNEAVMEKLVADHPYFSAARILLARKVYQQTGDLQSTAVKKALLFASQHHYAYQVILEEQILHEVEDRVATVIPEDTLPTETDEAMAASGIQAEVAAETLPEVENHIPAALTGDIPAEAFVAAPVLDETVTIMAAAAISPIAENHFAAVTEEVSAVETTPAAEVITAQPSADSPVSVADFEAATEPATLAPHLPPPPFIPATAENIPAPANESEAVQESAGPIKIFPLSDRVEETELIFQPLFTDDYFAYKRLKNPEEADDLNEQGAAEMKSFTSWLRQMKDNFVGKTSKDWYHQQLHRIYEEEDEPEVSETVEKMAMDSIVFNNDIVSETLAEIWVRQHQYANAIKIYQKLSLLNPDKNAYFAQKILDLKSKTDKK
jgi:hypothetical protein